MSTSSRAVDDERATATDFRPPSPSRASRRQSLRNKVTHRGNLVLNRPGRQTAAYFESGLEANALLVNGARPDVVDVIEQPSPISYRDRDGRVREWTFDQLVIFEDGTRCLVETKPWKKIVSKGLCETLEHVAAQIPPDVATHVTTMHEHDLPRSCVHDAMLFNAVRRDELNGDDDAILMIARGLAGATSVNTLVAASELGARGFRAIARLVADRRLEKVDSSPLDYTSLVRLGGDAK